jgi:hypothetical protein
MTPVDNSLSDAAVQIDCGLSGNQQESGLRRAERWRNWFTFGRSRVSDPL